MLRTSESLSILSARNGKLSTMGMLVVVGVVIVVLLWRILQVQEVRAKVEVAQAVTQYTDAIEKSLVDQFGTPQQAAYEGRLNEYFENLLRATGGDVDTVVDALSRDTDARHALVVECPTTEQTLQVLAPARLRRRGTARALSGAEAGKRVDMQRGVRTDLRAGVYAA